MTSFGVRRSAPPRSAAPCAWGAEHLADLGITLGEEIGTGGQAVVYAASRRGHGPIAVKRGLHDSRDLRARFALEAACLKALGAPWTPDLVCADTHGAGPPWIAMTRVDGDSLARRLDERPGPLGAAASLWIVHQIAHSLGRVHAAGYVHRDLTPANIFVDTRPPDRTARPALLIDFGTAYALGTEHDRTTVVGTPHYMAPEQVDGARPPGPACDIYALGCIFYRLVTGELPFTGDAAEVRKAHVSRRPRLPSSMVAIGAELEALLLRCLAKDPSQRPPVDALCEAILALEAQGSAPEMQATTAPAAPRPTHSRNAHTVVIGIRSELGLGQLRARLEGLDAHVARSLGTEHLFAVLGDGRDGEHLLLQCRELLGQLLASRTASAALLAVDRVRVISRAGGHVRCLASAQMAATCKVLQAHTGLFITRGALELLRDRAPETTDVSGTGDVRRVRLDTARSAGTGAQTRLVGRTETFRSLLVHADSALTERRPKVVALDGQIGVGKTHLLRAVGAELARRWSPDSVVFLSAPPPRARATCFRDLMRALLGAEPIQSPTHLLAQLALPEEPALVATATHLLHWDRPFDEGAVAAPGAMRMAARRLGGEAILWRCRRRPLALIIDDAHLADEYTFDAFSYAAGAAQHPLWLAISGRPEMAAMVASLGDSCDVHDQTLPSLDRAAAEELCVEELHPVTGIPGAVVADIAARSAGNPLLLREVIKSLRGGGFIRKTYDGRAWFIAWDEFRGAGQQSLLTLLASSTVHGLGESLGNQLKLCGLLVPRFSSQELADLLSALEREGVVAGLDLSAEYATAEMLRAGVLQGSAEQLSFRVELFRDPIADMIPRRERERIHEIALRHYQKHWREGDWEGLDRIAHHAAAAGRLETAASAFGQLARHAELGHRYLEAERRYTRALEAIAPHHHRSRAQLHRGRGTMRYRLGRYEDSIEDFDAGLRDAQLAGDREEEMALRLDLATAWDWLGRLDRSAAEVRRARALGGASVPAALQARFTMGEGRTAWRASEWDTSIDVLTEAARQSRALGEEGHEPLVASLLMLGVCLPYRGRVDEALAIFDELLARCRETGDRLHLAAALSNRRHALRWKGDVEAMVRDLERCAQIARELGILPLEAGTYDNLGELMHEQGKAEEALAYARKAIALEDRGEALRIPFGSALAARILAYHGRLHEAAAAAAIATPTRVELPELRVLATMVEHAVRGADEAAWLALVREGEEVLHEPAQRLELLEVAGLSLLRRGLPGPAMVLLERADALSRTFPCFAQARLARSMQRARRTGPLLAG